MASQYYKNKYHIDLEDASSEIPEITIHMIISI